MKLSFPLLATVALAPAPPTGDGGGFAQAPQLQTNAHTCSLLGTVGETTVAGTDAVTTSVTFGVGTTIAGPFEAGLDEFVDHLLLFMGCDTWEQGKVLGGTDINTALDLIRYKCNVTSPTYDSQGRYIAFTHDCGAHSPPDSNGCTSPGGTDSNNFDPCNQPGFHFHTSFKCLYDGQAAGHSTKVGIAEESTNTPIYGKYETTGVEATLDACGGHFGVTPDSNGAEVYHYHVQDEAPFTFGCWGPNDDGGEVTLAQCRSYYSTCGDDDIQEYTTAKGTFKYDLWCPCFDENGSNYVEGEGTMASDSDSDSAPASGAVTLSMSASVLGLLSLLQ